MNSLLFCVQKSLAKYSFRWIIIYMQQLSIDILQKIYNIITLDFTLIL